MFSNIFIGQGRKMISLVTTLGLITQFRTGYCVYFARRPVKLMFMTTLDILQCG